MCKSALRTFVLRSRLRTSINVSNRSGRDSFCSLFPIYVLLANSQIYKTHSHRCRDDVSKYSRSTCITSKTAVKVYNNYKTYATFAAERNLYSYQYGTCTCNQFFILLIKRCLTDKNAIKIASIGCAKESSESTGVLFM